MLSLQEVANNPANFQKQISLKSNDRLLIRPLEPSDRELLTSFLEGLSESTRMYYTLESYDQNTAQEMCDAIAKYDKLRFIVIERKTERIVGLMEFSFDIMRKELDRFAKYGVHLDKETDCRFGPCLSDDFQGKGVGQEIFPFIVEIANEFGKKRIILWGGVMRSNVRAIKFYEKLGFENLGEYMSDDDYIALDMIYKL